jgi:hypothetical protein
VLSCIASVRALRVTAVDLPDNQNRSTRERSERDSDGRFASEASFAKLLEAMIHALCNNAGSETGFRLLRAGCTFVSLGLKNREVSAERLAAEDATTRALRLDGRPCIMCLTNMSRLRHQWCHSCFSVITDFNYSPKQHCNALHDQQCASESQNSLFLEAA